MRQPEIFSLQQDYDDRQMISNAIEGPCGTVTLCLAAGALGALWAKANAYANNDGSVDEASSADQLMFLTVCTGATIGAERVMNAIAPALSEACQVTAGLGMMCSEAVRKLIP